MPKLSDFRCHECKTVFECWIDTTAMASPQCPDCKHPHTTRLIGGTHPDIIGMATDGAQSSDGFASSINKWDRMRRKQMEIEKRNLRNHGDYY